MLHFERHLVVDKLSLPKTKRRLKVILQRSSSFFFFTFYFLDFAKQIFFLGVSALILYSILYYDPQTKKKISFITGKLPLKTKTEKKMVQQWLVDLLKKKLLLVNSEVVD